MEKNPGQRVNHPHLIFVHHLREHGLVVSMIDVAAMLNIRHLVIIGWGYHRPQLRQESSVSLTNKIALESTTHLDRALRILD
jgi:hypothetical protein